MKFIAASLVFLLIAAVLGLGMGLAAHGYGLWFLILAVIGFIFMFIRYGCLGH